MRASSGPSIPSAAAGGAPGTARTHPLVPRDRQSKESRATSKHFYLNGHLRGLSAAWRHGRQALLCALSAGEPCRQFVGSFSRTDRAFLSYNKTSLESLLEWLRSLNGSAGLRVWKDCRGQRRRRGMTFGTQKLRAGAGNASE